MIKDLAWNTFKKTGNIHTFLEFKQVQNLEKEMYQEHTKEEFGTEWIQPKQKVESNGTNQDEGNCNCRK